MCIEPIHGNTQISSLRMTLVEYPAAQLGENLSNHSRPIASNVSPPVIFSARRFAAGSMPFLKSRKDAQAQQLLLAVDPELEAPPALASGVTSRYRPPPSIILKGFSRGLAAEIAAFVSIAGGNTF
jgi:hypothetical protein